MPSNSPSLWVVATPLGNHGDLSPRAREVLESVDMVLAEDTRRTGLLFKSTGVTAKKLVSFHDHNEEAKAPGIIAAMEEGQVYAVVSDAGMPLFSDPGFRLVKLAREKGICVSVVPGPSAPLTALAASGIAPQPFTFIGFPPRKASDQKKLFEEFSNLRSTLVFFERKNRLAATLQAAYEVLGPRELCVARELTKLHEEFILGRLEKHQEIPQDLLGEITVVIGPPESGGKTSEEELLKLIAEETALGGKPKEIARRVKEEASGWTVKAVYQFMQDN
ncbi:16S rRNA (cytidine(1402)-2'-O)-methyltransferase [Halodesulfovibrio spirochaetisodalis]|uniref:Ribosomal RNA small subunit methyltransferase I n=1 Tax=Halodesulfovibrio spirochaetisodalis TaxID=1560234 RepID=A0A1B7XL71_9BACT|nr:16S rRNA (cytidine(1402)-2'-O)-methyltransferase [Halodesulfovibrio spirochaetisodalis]OBQ56270.1 tetrapyrrole methylase [Halodesulfovibrio spirochaetisodalis]